MFSQTNAAKELASQESNLAKPNMVLYMMSGVNHETFQQHIYNDLAVKQPEVFRDSRLYSLKTSQPSSPIASWISLFSGCRPEVHGIFGNSLTLDIQSLDNLFHQLDDEDQVEFMVFGNDFFEDVLSQVFPNVKVSQNYKDGKFRSVMKSPHYAASSKLERIGMFIDYY